MPGCQPDKHGTDQPLLQHYNGRPIPNDDDATLLLSTVEPQCQAAARSGALRLPDREGEERRTDRLREDERAQVAIPRSLEQGSARRLNAAERRTRSLRTDQAVLTASQRRPNHVRGL